MKKFFQFILVVVMIFTSGNFFFSAETQAAEQTTKPNVDSLNAFDMAITGKAEPNSQIVAKYHISQSIVASGTANSRGDFILPLSQRIAAGAQVDITAKAPNKDISEVVAVFTGPGSLGTPVASSPYTTIVNENGGIVSGKPLDLDHALQLTYDGSDIIKDVLINGKATSDPVSTLNRGDTIKVKNAGFYKGTPVTLVIKYITGTKSKSDPILPYPAEDATLKLTVKKAIPLRIEVQSMTGYHTGMNLETSIETNEGTPISDASVIFPLARRVSDIEGSQTQRLTRSSLISQESVKNVVVLEDKANPDRWRYNYLNNKASDLRMDLTYVGMNYVLYNLDSRKTSRLSFFYGGEKNNNPDQASAITLFENLPMIVRLNYEKPTIEKIQTDNEFKLNTLFKQDLIKQSEAFYPEKLDLKLKIGKENLITDSNLLSGLKVQDKDGNDLTKEVTIKNISSGVVNVEVPKTLLSRLGNNQLQVIGQFDINTDSPALVDIYQDNYFHFPLQIENSETNEAVTGEALVKMPAPEGSPTPNKKVTLHSSTANLNPADFVENLHSILPNDEVEAIGFKEEKTFDTLGQEEVTVKIRSKLTGAEGSVTVPVEVIGKLTFKQVPAALNFVNTSVSTQAKNLERQDPNWKIDIDNSIGKNWQVKAEATPVQDEEQKTYPQALVFKKENGETANLVEGQQIIATGDGTNASPTVSWAADKGILFRYDPGAMKAGIYQSTLTFTLEDTPPI